MKTKTNTKIVKVLAIVAQMNRGGLESRLMDIIRNIDYSRVCLDVFSYRQEKGAMDDEIVALGGTVYYNPPLTPQNMFRYVHYFEHFLRAHPEYKIVHAHQDAWCSVFCKGAYFAGVPVRIAHSRTAISSFTAENIAKNLIKLPAKKYATHYFAVSKLAGIWLFGKKNLQSGKVQIWKNAIDCEKFRFRKTVREKIRNQLGIENKKVLIHVGNFTPPKNQAYLLNVFKALSVKTDGYCLIFVGGETAAGLQRDAKEKARVLGIAGDVKFLGNRPDVSELLQAADVFCFPSKFEGLPGAVLEAQAAGLPCIISQTITPEVRVLNTLKALPLTNSEELWKTEIESSFNVSRRDTYQEMVRAGFDIKQLVNSLMKFYETVGE